ncbi:MAG: hypothetical protein ACI33P_12890, partial [Lysinibacillus sp.]
AFSYLYGRIYRYKALFSLAVRGGARQGVTSVDMMEEKGTPVKKKALQVGKHVLKKRRVAYDRNDDGQII